MPYLPLLRAYQVQVKSDLSVVSFTVREDHLESREIYTRLLIIKRAPG
jgi:hypothetical protein